MANKLINRVIDVHNELEDATILEGGPDVSLKLFLLRHWNKTKACVKELERV